ncbi:MAG: hypothetical protein ACRYG5_00250 [Janthinobacterium lividum]
MGSRRDGWRACRGIGSRACARFGATRFDALRVRPGSELLGLVAGYILLAFCGIGRRLALRVIQPLLVVRLLLPIGGSVLRAQAGVVATLRRLCCILLLLLRERGSILAIGLRALRRIGVTLRLRQRIAPVAFLRICRTFLSRQHKLLGADLRLLVTHHIASLVQALVDEEFRIAIVLRRLVTIVVRLAAVVEHFLPRAKTSIARRTWRACGGLVRCG